MLGYSKQEFLDKKIWDISAFKNIEYSKQLFKKLKEKEYVRYNDLPLETSEGDHRHVEFLCNVYLVDGEKVIQCNIRDISKQRQYENSLNLNLEKKDVLLRELQHRSKNSFNMITNLIHLKSYGPVTKETKKILQELVFRVKSISDLYSLLYQSGSFYEVPLKTYCTTVIESMCRLSKKIKMTYYLEDNEVTAKDAAIIGMILVELLSNVIKYAFPGTQKGIVNIEMLFINPKIVLIIEDNGIGLDKNFDSNKIKSTGIHLVKLMVEQLKGNIQFNSENGTKIRIEFTPDNIHEIYETDEEKDQ